jgi:hypothetical protein
MADYDNSATGPGAQFPDGAIETSWDDCNPLIAASAVKRKHLFGIPLVSATIDPTTGKPDAMDSELIKEFIVDAVSLVELEVGFEIFNRQHEERHPYDRPASDSFGYTVLRHRPVSSIEELAVRSNDGVNIWDVPKGWIDRGYLHQGQINLLPFAVSAQSGVVIPTTGPTGMGLIPSIFKQNWVPGLWTVKYTTGFKKGAIPSIVNQLIGVTAAMEILSALATTYARSNSSSLSIDGLSQSISTPGPELFNVRLEALGEKRKWMVNKIKRLFGLGFFSDNV